MRDAVLALWAAFPDPRDDSRPAGDDNVVTCKTLIGAHSGPFLALSPTGNRMSLDIIDRLRVADGKPLKYWCVVDQLSLLRGVDARPRANA